MKILKPVISIILLFTLLATMSINVFAASTKATYRSSTVVDYTVTGSKRSEQILNVTCNYKSIKSDRFTIKNTGSGTIWLYKGGIFIKELRPGISYSSSYTLAKKESLQVRSQSGGNHKIRLSSTSGIIYFN